MDLRNNRIGIYEKALPNAFSWKEKIDCAKSAGYDFIEISIDESDERLARLDWSKEEILALKTLLIEEDFYIHSMCLSGHRRYPFGSSDPKKEAKAYEILEKAVKFAEWLGIRNIQLAGYDVYYEDQSEATKERFLKGLKYAAQLASRTNVMMSIEIMDTPFIGTISKCMDFIEAVNSPWLNIYPDLGNLSQWTKVPSEELRKGAHKIVAIHLKETRPGRFKEVPFGTGTVDFKALFKTLKTMAYSGPFLVEMWADNKIEASKEEVIKNIEAAKEWLVEKM